jgi:uncharacterized membrane protein YbhN (UPF0104 family)
MTRKSAEPPPRTELGKLQRNWPIRSISILFGIAVLLVLGLVVMHAADLEKLGQILRHAKPVWLLAALVLQASTYVSVALGWKMVVGKAGHPQPLSRLIPIALSKMFADVAVPIAGMSGNMLLVARLRAMGVPRATAIAALLVSVVGLYTVYALFALMMMLILWLHGKASLLTMSFVTAFLFVSLAIPGLALWLRKRGSQPRPSILDRFPGAAAFLKMVGEAPIGLVGSRRLIAGVAAINSLIFLADVATMLICFRAIGIDIPYETGFVAVMAGLIGATLGPIPLGLGSYEAGATAMLALMGVPVAAALTGTLLLRGFTLWLPLVPGFVLTRKSLKHRAQRLRRATRPPRLSTGAKG